jgi:apolipoprotein N-acyltransferase
MGFTHNLLNRCAAHPRWCAVALGGLAACGFEPLHLWPLTLAALAALMELALRAPTPKQATLLGWLFGIGHFTIGNTWIATAFTYQSNMPAWLGWVAVFLLSLYLAVYPALAVLAARTFGRANYASFLLSFAAFWIVTEWMRAWVFTGFAWNPLGMAALGGFDRPGLASLAPWLGTYGLSGLVALLAGSWLLAVKRGKLDLRGTAMLVLPTLLMLLPSPRDRTEGTLPYTVVQPDITQEQLNDPANFARQFEVSAALSRARKPGETRLVLWPESGVQDYLRDGYPPLAYADYTFGGDPALARGRLAGAIGKDSLLLAGTTDLDFRNGRLTGAGNTVTALDGTGAIRGSYAKAHLVPYGEYLPMRWLLEPLGVSRLVPGEMDFIPGPGPLTLDLGRWGKAGVQICYEIIFSGEVVQPGHRPDYLVNLSNDGWFGAWGPPQHLAQARMRAIEEGLPLLRSTTTGISAVIGADGAVRQFIPAGKPGRLDGLVPPAHAPTLFSRLGNLLPLCWSVVLLVLSLVATRRRHS